MKPGDLVKLETAQFKDHKTNEPTGFFKRAYAGIKIGDIGIILERFGKERCRVLFGQKVSEVWREDLRPIDVDSKFIR
jgi:hypothetical protein